MRRDIAGPIHFFCAAQRNKFQRSKLFSLHTFEILKADLRVYRLTLKAGTAAKRIANLTILLKWTPNGAQN